MPRPLPPCCPQPSIYTRKNLPLPLPAHSWHPRYNGKFDSIGLIPPKTEILPRTPQISAEAAATLSSSPPRSPAASLGASL